MSPDDHAALNEDELRSRLSEVEETLRAIHHGEVDALLIVDDSGERVYTLRGADTPYRVLVERMREGAATLTTDGAIVYCNQRFADLVNVPLQHAIGASMERFVAEGDRRNLKKMVDEGRGTLQTQILREGDMATEVQISVSAVTLDDVEHRTLIVSDISTLMKAQRESRAKDEFLAMLAHELRNPLGAIQGAVHALTTLNATDATRAREIIQRQVFHMARLVDDLLDVGRVVTGKIVLNRRPVDFAQCVRSSVSALTAGQLAEGRVQLTTLPVWVDGDSVRLEQIVGNLVSNALKFSGSDKKVQVWVGPDGAGSAVCRVTDQGSGIDAALLPKIFDLFVQATDTIDRRRGGLGIGLTLVRRLTELHGGQIVVASAGAGCGSEFTVRLPAIPARVAPAARAARPAASPRRILLVDDNDDSREMYRMLLTSLGHTVFEAQDGAQALALLPAAMPDVAFIDIGLPVIDGYELARRMRDTPLGRVMTLVALTGYGFPEDKERARQAGFDRHLVKPVEAAVLQRELELVRVTTRS